MNARQKVERGLAMTVGSLMLSILGCLLIYGVWNHRQQQVNREMTVALIHYAKVVSFMVPAPTIVIGPAPQPWYVTQFYLWMSVLILWSLSVVWKGISRTKIGLSMLE